jgi:hypothetical protein
MSVHATTQNMYQDENQKNGRKANEGIKSPGIFCFCFFDLYINIIAVAVLCPLNFAPGFISPAIQ